jgi:hypothetical protein
MIRIGIDPGKNGFICVFNTNESVEVKNGEWMPLIPNPLTYYSIPLINKEVDLRSLDVIFNSPEFKTDNIHCCIEDVHAIFGSAAKATFNFGWIVGVLEAMLVSYEIPYTKVKPKEWQKEMWQGIPLQKKPNGRTDTKAMSLLAAKRLFPNEDLTATERSVKPHDGKADALLLAEYCKRKF